MADCSSETISVPTMENFLFLSASATAGPERSARSPRAQESLTVSTAAVHASGAGSGVEEDIFFFLPTLAGIPLGFVQQAQSFHQQTLGVQGSGLLGGLALEVEFEVALGPAQDFENR